MFICMAYLGAFRAIIWHQYALLLVGLISLFILLGARCNENICIENAREPVKTAAAVLIAQKGARARAQELFSRYLVRVGATTLFLSSTTILDWAQKNS